jgi:membrane protein
MLEDNRSMPALRPWEDVTYDAEHPGDISSCGCLDIIARLVGSLRRNSMWLRLAGALLPLVVP